jgi:hypothetical protein
MRYVVFFKVNIGSSGDRQDSFDIMFLVSLNLLLRRGVFLAVGIAEMKIAPLLSMPSNTQVKSCIFCIKSDNIILILYNSSH